ncbi:hypothetical protein FKM82_020966 [Ascaphus truei]
MGERGEWEDGQHALCTGVEGAARKLGAGAARAGPGRGRRPRAGGGACCILPHPPTACSQLESPRQHRQRHCTLPACARSPASPRAACNHATVPLARTYPTLQPALCMGTGTHSPSQVSGGSSITGWVHPLPTSHRCSPPPCLDEIDEG